MIDTSIAAVGTAVGVVYKQEIIELFNNLIESFSK